MLIARVGRSGLTPAIQHGHPVPHIVYLKHYEMENTKVRHVDSDHHRGDDIHKSKVVRELSPNRVYAKVKPPSKHRMPFVV